MLQGGEKRRPCLRIERSTDSGTQVEWMYESLDIMRYLGGVTRVNKGALRAKSKITERKHRFKNNGSKAREIIMKLGILAGYSGRKFNIAMDAIKHAESWVTTRFGQRKPGSDAVTPAAWILAQTERLKVGTAIMQMLRAHLPWQPRPLSLGVSGTFICGLGASGPQVVEGWHGVPTASQ